MLYIFFLSLALIAIAELADKSQLLALVFATRYKAWQVLLGIFISTLLAFSLTAAVGQTLGSLIPERLMPWISGVLFIGFGIWTLRDEEEEGEGAERAPARLGPVAATAVAFFLAEFGDKTQIMTLAIAADPGSALLAYVQGAGPVVGQWARSAAVSARSLSPLLRFASVTLGATLGMVLADAVAILVGRQLGKKLPEKLLKRVSGTAFILFGLLSIGSTFIA